MKVFLAGATGFVGKHMLKRLLLEDHEVRILMRSSEEGPRIVDLGLGGVPFEKMKLSQAPGDVVSGKGLYEGMQGCDAVIYLVGIIMEKGSNTFDAVHHIGVRNAVEAAKRNGIKRFVLMSALGVRADGVAAYQTSKWKGEEEVRKSGIPYCILRPSLIFGPGDGFVTQMIDTMRKAPLVRPVPGDGSPKFRPIHIDDVTFCFARALTSVAATNQTIDLGGPDELTLNQVLEEIARCAGVRKPAVHIPMPLMLAGAAIVQTVLPNPPVTVGQLKMLSEGSTCDIAPMVRIFGVQPKTFQGCGREAPVS